MAGLPVGRGGFALVAVGGLGESGVVGGVGGEVEIEVAEEEGEALVAVLVEAEEDDAADQVAGGLEVVEVFVGRERTGSGERAGKRGRSGGAEHGRVNVARAELIPGFAGVEIGLGMPVVGEVMLDAEAGLERRRLGEVAQRRAEGSDVDGLAGGRGGGGEGGRVDDLLSLARAVEAVGLGGDGFGHDAGEEAGVEMEDGLRVLVDGPCQAGARREVGKTGGRGLNCVAEPAGEREPRAELKSVFGVESQLPLCEGDQRGAGGDGEAGGRAAWQVEERAAVLLEAGDGGGAGGGIIVRVERGRVASTKGERAVEGVRIGFVNKDAERLRADFPRLLVVRVEKVFVDFEVALAVVEILRGAAATEEETGDVEAGSGRERRLLGVFPGETDVGFVKEIDADGLGVGDAEVVLADGGVVAGAREDEPSDALVAEVVSMRGERGGDDVGRSIASPRVRRRSRDVAARRRFDGTRSGRRCRRG